MEPKVKIEILSRDDLDRIHTATLSVLNNTGVAFNEERALKTLKEAGASVDERTKIVTFPDYLIKEALNNVPKRVDLYARNRKFDLSLEGRRVHFGAGGPNIPKVMDLETGELRDPTGKDLMELTRLADALENVHSMGGITTVSEVPKEFADLHRWRILFNNTEKTIFDGAGGIVSGKIVAQAFIGMAAAVVGGLDVLQKKPLIAGFACPTSPLTHPLESLEWLTEFAEKRLPFITLSEPMVGASAPVTLAGALVLMNSEVLSSLVLSQLVNKGTPVLYGANPFPVDMKTGLISIAAPETGILGAASTQLAQYYGMPSTSVCGVDTKTLDVQFGYEKSPLVMASISGCNLIGCAGMLESGLTGSFEDLVLTDEFIEILARFMRGVEVDEDTLAVDIINRVGVGGHFLSQPHTLKYAMSEIWYPTLINRESRSKWQTGGSKTMQERAKERARKILKEHYPEPLEKEAQEEISMIVRETEKIISEMSL